MAEDINYSALRGNPELFRINLLHAVEEITTCMSEEHTPSKGHSEDDALQNHLQILQSIFKQSMNEVINKVWTQLEIPSKVSFIHQLESTYPSDSIAWRPTTGEIPMLNLRGHYLTDTKERILYKLKKCEAESEELKRTMHAKAIALRKSLKKIRKSETSAMTLYSDYEKIIRDAG